MPALPPVWDPAGAVDKLPQPFRMIDKILGEVLDKVLGVVGQREHQKKVEEESRIDLTFAPHAVVEVAPEAVGFAPLGIAGIAIVAMPGGALCVQSARDASVSNTDAESHTSNVTAMEANGLLAASGRVLAAASKEMLTIHEVDVQACDMTLLASIPLPAEPDGSQAAPCRVVWSTNLGHLAVCYSSGAIVLYSVTLPPPNVGLESVGAFLAVSLSAFGETKVEQLLHISAATAKAFCLGSATVGESQIVWQQQQRPDKGPHSDRYHKSARGAYIWWRGTNRLLLVDLCSAAAAAAKASAATAVAETAAAAAAAAQPAGKGGAAAAKGVAAKGAASAAQEPAAASTSAGGPAAPPTLPYIAPNTRDWWFPHPITASCTSYNSQKLAFGLGDGSVLIWEDGSCIYTKVLSRLQGAITSLAWVNHLPLKLMCASSAGQVVLVDLVKPEDSSQKPYELPQPIDHIHFLPNEPFALCVCRGGTPPDDGPSTSKPGSSGSNSIGAGQQQQHKTRRPRLIWYSIADEKPVAELMGPEAGQGFGYACCPQPPGDAPIQEAPPPPPTATPRARTSASGAAGAPKPRTSAAGNAPAAGATAPAAAVPPLTTPLFPTGLFPAFAFKDTYLIAGGDVCAKVVKSRFRDSDDGKPPKRVAQLYMYKVDALLRHLLPMDAAHAQLGKVVLDRLLADLEAPKAKKGKGKRVKVDVEDPDAPKLHSSMRKPDPLDPGAANAGRGSSRASNRHITFSSEDGLFDDDPAAAKDGKKYPKESHKLFPKEGARGLKLGMGDVAMALMAANGKPKLSPLDLDKAKQQDATGTAGLPERSQSPPWHHTNPLARIHPDWEEAPVMVRIMERLEHKAGGRKKRDKHVETLAQDMLAKFARAPGGRSNLLVPAAGPQ